jgi:hypothetical protein
VPNYIETAKNANWKIFYFASSRLCGKIFPKVINNPFTFSPSNGLTAKPAENPSCDLPHKTHPAMKMKIYMVCLALLIGLGATGQIAAWDFFGQSFPVTCTATTFNANLVSASGASDITRGPGAAASGGVNSFRTTGFQNNGISTANTDYFQITLRASPGYKLSLSTLDAKFNGTSTFFASPGVTSQFAYSLDGTSFTLIGSPVQSTSLTMAQVNLSAISDLQNVYSATIVTIRYYASGQTSTGGWGFYSGTAGTNGLTVGGTVADATIVPPTIQASEITFGNIGQTQLSLSWIPGNGDKRVVKINTANDFTPPANGSDPTANTAYSGSGQQVVYNYSGSAIPAITGLVAGSTYWFRIYEYNGAGTLTQFNTSNASNNPNSQVTSTVFLPPTVTSPTVSSISAESAILGGHITNNGGSAIIERGTVWSTLSPVTISDHFLAEGGTDTGVFIQPRIGFPAGTKIFFTALVSNGIGSALAMESTFYSLSMEPTDHVAGFTATATGTTSMDLSWTPLSSGANGYLILRKQGTAGAVSVPSDATQYLPGTTIGDAAVAAVVTNGNTGNQTISGLSPGTSYAFTIFPFSWDGANPGTTNYLTIPPIPEATATTSIPAVAIYHWSGMVSPDFANPGNWNPERTIPALNDILIFDNGISATLTNVLSQTIGQLMVNSNTAITLQGSGTLAIAGDEGDDLVVYSGCQLNVSGSNVVSILVSGSATGKISGTMTLSGGGHRLLAAASGGITFQAGGSFKTGSGFTGNPFGTVNLNSVVFSSGSTYICQAGGNPFGAAAPSSVVVFQAGSLYRLDAYAVPSFGGRTYGNFEMNYTGLVTVTGSSAVSIDNFTASQGFFYFNLTGNPGHSIKGNIFVSAVATLVFSPSSPGTVNLNGTTPQTISGTGAIFTGQNSTVVIGNSAGVTLLADAELNNLTISNGARLTISPNATLTVVGDLVNMGP